MGSVVVWYSHYLNSFVAYTTQVTKDTMSRLSSEKTTTIVNEEGISVSTYDVESGVENSKGFGHNPFKDPKVAEYYRELYESSGYECRAAFDPEFTWTESEEKKLVRKLNWRVAMTACFLFVALQLDRGNLAQAVADNLLKDMHMNTNDYNVGNQIFYVSFFVAELPSQLISKRLGPDRFVPFQMCAWSAVAMSQAAMHNKTGFYICRCLLGLLEGGFIADLVLWLTYFFTSKELSLRLSWFWTSLSIVQIVSALMAYGILRMRGKHGLTGWQWLFLLEGIITFLIGLAGFYLMVPSAVQTKNWMHPKGWFTEREEKIVVNRVLRDDPSKGDMHNRQPLSFKLIWEALKDYYLWPIYAIGLVAYAAYNTLGAYLTLTLKSVGFGTLNVQLLSIPYQVIHIILLIGITWLSERLNERAYMGIIAAVWNSLFVGILRWWSGSLVNAWPTFALCTLLLGAPYIHAICVSWVSRNSNSIKTRAVSSALYNMAVQVGSIYCTQIYRNDDKPLYHRGNTVLFVFAIGTIPLYLFTKWFYHSINTKREKIWSEMTDEERKEYIATTEDKGNRRLDFRFAE
ncbi:putative transporter YIL166C [Kluyveromyces marxianus]|uniref:Transporter YIL166C n=1 Tax=Kluyveromyces marxianus TaxID=4911 RepID=A0ABX6EQ98_KLUMA|nr:putative transporter YIL166C [Kluyveromyces marxianus]